MSPNLRAMSVRLRWLRSSPTWSQLPNTGTGKGPGGSLKRLPRSLEMAMARTMAEKSAKRVFSRKRRSISVSYELVWRNMEMGGIIYGEVKLGGW